MENAFGRVASVFALAVALFLVPLYINCQKADYMRSIIVTVKTIELVDTVRNTGCLTGSVYDNYRNSLSLLGLGYTVRMEHQKRGIYGTDTVWISTTEGEIEEALYLQDQYDFSVGDYFKIIVYDSKEKKVISYYGGSIRNERT